MPFDGALCAGRPPPLPWLTDSDPAPDGAVDAPPLELPPLELPPAPELLRLMPLLTEPPPDETAGELAATAFEAAVDAPLAGAAVGLA